jgi:probable phosphoglycerate mutase
VGSLVIVLVRHGETEWSRTGRHTGRTDLPLTDEGRAEAAQLRPALAKYSFAAVFVSPLVRARHTAELAGLTDSASAVVTVDPDLVEWDYGAAEGRTTAELRATDPHWNVFDDGCPDGESLDHVAERVDRVIARCREVDGDVAVVSHAHLLRVFGARWIDQPPLSARHLRLDTAAWCELDHEREWPTINRWNLTAT